MDTSGTTHHRSTRATQAIAALLIVLVLAAACGGASESAELEEDVAEPTVMPTQVEQPTPEPTAAPTAVEEPTPMPAEAEEASDASDTTPAGETLDWVVGLLNDQSADTDEVAAKFSPRFLQAVPIEQIMGLLPQFWGPEWTIVSADVGDDVAEAVIAAEGQSNLDVQLQVSRTEPHLIEGLLFTPAVDAPVVETTEDYEEALADAGPISTVGLFEVVDAECTTVLDLGAETLMPTGSIFKLWVLAELAHQIELGEASWDETFPVQSIYKSSPDGTIFAMDEGTDVSLFDYAAEMISISDNSATDHLVARLGRERVEQAIGRSGVAQPELNIPMLTTSELFRIKFDPEPPNSDDYRALDSQARRDLLDQLQSEMWIESIDELPLVNAEGVSIEDPRDHDIEWFATPLDLCRTHVHLADLASRQGLGEVAEILSINPTAGIDFDPADWDDLRYKGGSEQGLVAVAWWMQRSDDRVFVLAGGVENPDTALNVVAAVAALQQGATLAAQID